MNVLHLPNNAASMLSHTVRGLRQMGVAARGLVWGSARIRSADGVRVIEAAEARHSVRWLLAKARWSIAFLRMALWADVIHWYWGAPSLAGGIDLQLLRLLNRPGVVEWLGSDIRVPEVEFADNPYYRAVFDRGYEYRALENLGQSRRVQAQFAAIGFLSAGATGMAQYVQSDIFPKTRFLPQRLMMSDYQPIYPSVNTARPVVVHSPTAPVGKGTPVVMQAVELLQAKYDFEFRLVQGVPRIQALAIMQSADVFLDQFVSCAHGLAALEAMALGKPVLCYIKPSLMAQYPSDLPIVNANPDNLAQVLGDLLQDGRQRRELGQRGRAYVEEHHDVIRLGGELKALYAELLANSRTRSYGTRL